VATGAEQDGDGKLVYRRGAEAVPARQDKARAEIAPVRLPEWALRPAPSEARPPRPLAPSAMAEDREAAPAPSASARAAAERGNLIHALLERLPPVAPTQRRDAALRWLQASGVGEHQKPEEIADLVCGLLGDDRFSALFGPDSLPEAPIAATLPDGRVIAGTVDRLLVEADRVLVIDYKTGRAPASTAEIPSAHRRQMSAYVEALSVIFPARKVVAALLYTATATLFELAA
ncbi:MAG TPA: PD-(D/E)XK nuclease family protein, partial [Sphingomicrobium sp.]|nr:PD-(D/E)XK nuclease family protein [Sphingomicrobium sp.]